MEKIEDFFEPVDDGDNLFNDLEDQQDVRETLDTAEQSDSLGVLDKFLQSKGFVDAKIRVVGEDNSESDVPFKDLPEEDQLEILNSLSGVDPEGVVELPDEDQVLIDELKKNNLTLSGFLELYKQSILEEIQESYSSYDIDSYDDKELFLLDLKNKYDLTEEELEKELEKELADEELFKKKVSKLRSEYKELEDQYKAAQQEEFERQQQLQYDDFVDQISTVAGNISEFHGIELEPEEKNGVLSYILELDNEGISEFFKDINNPEKLYEAAWYLKYGKDAFKIIEEAYEAEIAKLSKDNPSVVRKETQTNNTDKPKSVFDLI